MELFGQTGLATLERDRDVNTEFDEIVSLSWPSQVYLDEAGKLQERPACREYMLGNPDRPVAKYREHAVETVKENLLTIVTARTATGKSTELPQYLFESGHFGKITVTQPRIVAARELKRYVEITIAASLNDPEHNLVGYRTAPEGEDSDDNAITYVTDGLQLMHEISHNGIAEDQVLVIDEFHERGENMDALLAIAVEKGIRVVVMSATLDADKLSSHYSEVMGVEVPIIDIPGASFEIEEHESTDFDRDVVEAARRHENILVFVPGREQINSCLSRFSRKVPKGYTLLGLHGDQTPNEQSKVFGSYPNGVIIFSTSVGQTSITIPGIDTVIDCGYERTGTLSEEGQYTLAMQPSSRATSEQRRGRAGREKDGKYYRSQYPGFPKLPPLDDIAAYDVASIQRTQTQGMQLKLAAFGHTMQSLPFYELPSEVEMNRGNERLVRLGLFNRLGRTALDGYEITKLGKEAAHLPLDANMACMVLSSRRYGSDVELQMMAAAVVRQTNGITSTAKGMDKWRQLTEDSHSDIIAGIDYMIAAMERTGAQQERANIVQLRYSKAFRAFQELARRRGLDVYDLQTPTEEQRAQLSDSILAGTNEVFTRSGALSYTNGNNRRYYLASSSIMEEGTELVSGESVHIEHVHRGKIITNKSIAAATKVTAEQLVAALPRRATTVVDKFEIDDTGWAVTDERVFFDGGATRQHISRRANPSIAVHGFIVDQIFSDDGKDSANFPPEVIQARRMIAGFRRLQNRTTEDLGVDYSLKQIIAKTIRESPYNISRSYKDISPYIDLQAIDDIVPEEIRAEILLGSPDSVTVVDEIVGELKFDVEYVEGSDRAHVTIPARFYHLLPFTLEAHRLSVRPNSKTPYKALEKAKSDYEQPSRSNRRGGSLLGATVLRIERRKHRTEKRNKIKTSKSTPPPRLDPYRRAS